jgi:uncharacterized protein (DUF2267 family)
MDHEEFITIVEQFVGADRAEAERAVHATLQTLGERLDRGETRQLAAQLPPEDAPWIGTATPAEGFDSEEFVRRIAEREGVDLATAQRHAAAVLAALQRAVDAAEWADVTAELSSDFATLLPRGPLVETMDVDAFLRRVGERAGIDVSTARRAADAVLETLAERIAGGEVEDLVRRLPPELREPLRRGRDRTGGDPQPMKLERFVHRIAEREGVGDREAAEHARAVLQTLRDAVGHDEFLDVTVQFPDEYRVLIA